MSKGSKATRNNKTLLKFGHGVQTCIQSSWKVATGPLSRFASHVHSNFIQGQSEIHETLSYIKKNHQ